MVPIVAYPKNKVIPKETIPKISPQMGIGTFRKNFFALSTLCSHTPSLFIIIDINQKYVIILNEIFIFVK